MKQGLVGQVVVALALAGTLAWAGGLGGGGGGGGITGSGAAGDLTAWSGVTSLTGVAPTDDRVLVGSGTAWQATALPACVGAADALTYDTQANAFGCNTIAPGLTGAGEAGQLAFFTAPDALAGSADLTWDSRAPGRPKHLMMKLDGDFFAALGPDSDMGRNNVLAIGQEWADVHPALLTIYTHYSAEPYAYGRVELGFMPDLGNVGLRFAETEPLYESFTIGVTGLGPLQFAVAAMPMWEMTYSALAPVATQDLGTELNPVNTGYFGTSLQAPLLTSATGAHLTLQAAATKNIILLDIPDSNPGIVGALYKSGTNLLISAGP